MAIRGLSVAVVWYFVLVVSHVSGQSFSDCDADDYYSSIDINSRTELKNLVQSTHRRVLPYTDNGGDDVWKALMDLDVASSDDSKVHLIYADVDVSASLFNTPDGGWNREHVWPKSRGVETSGADFTDIHHLKPSDWNVNSARGNKYFSECRDSSECVVPATGDAAEDTAADNSVWLPPQSARGIVARAILYMELRYDGTRSGELDLTLTDCPSDDGSRDLSEMAYLSPLLEWHEAYPPTNAEVLRNDKACERWQGNRNPFVDHPDLVKKLYGDPNQDCSTGPAPTDAPEGAPPTSGVCQSLFPGAVMVIGVNSDNPDLVSMVALTPLERGTKLYMTDNAWTGNGFRNNEGTMMMEVQDDGIAAGEVFSFSQDDGSIWQDISGDFSLSADGDTVLLYCETEDSELLHVSAFSFSGDWKAGGLTESSYGTDSSALPDVLSDVAVTLVHLDNYRYEGTTTGTASTLQKAITAPWNWEGANDSSFPNQSGSFTVLDSDGKTSVAFSRSHSTTLEAVVLTVLATGLF